MYNDVKLEKGLYNLSGKTFTQALEELDPCSAYESTPLGNLDAFERQLKRFNIRIAGENCDCVEKFFTSTETAVLFPEYVTRCIRKGFNDSVLSSVCAVKTVCESSQYLGCVLDDSAKYNPVGEAYTLSSSNVREGSTPVVLNKFGRLISSSYEAVRKQRLDVFGVMLRSIGVKLAGAVIGKAVEALVSNAETVTTAELTYSDLAELYGKFKNFDMTTVIASPAVASQIVAMEQLMNTKTDAEKKLYLPFGSELIKTAAADNSTIIGLDREFALEFITSTDLVIEADKLIDRQLDRVAVSVTCGFRKITPDAVKVLVISE